MAEPDPNAPQAATPVAQPSPAARSTAAWIAEAARRLRQGEAAPPLPRVRDEEPFDLGRGAYFDLLERHLQELRLEAMTQRRLADRLLEEAIPDGPTAEKEREKLRRRLQKAAHREAITLLRDAARPLDDEMLSTRWRRLLREERSDLLILLAWLTGVAGIVAAIAWALIRYT